MGLLRIEDYGVTWEWIDFSDCSWVGNYWYRGAFCFAYDPFNANRVLAGRGSFSGGQDDGAHIIESYDREKNWDIVQTDILQGDYAAVFSLVWDPKQASESVYASTNKGIFRSDDRGHNSDQVGAPSEVGVSKLRLLAAATAWVPEDQDGDTFLYLTAKRDDNDVNTPAYIFRSDDGGTNWTPIATVTGMGTRDDHYFYWIRCLQDVPQTNQHTVITGMYGGYECNLYHSDDAWSDDPSWQWLVSEEDVEQLHWWTQARCGQACTHLAVDQDRIVFGGANVFLGSGWQDGDPYWQDITSDDHGSCVWSGRGLEPTGILDIECHQNGEVWVAVADCRVWKKATGWYSWELVHDPADPNSCFHTPWGANINPNPEKPQHGCDGVCLALDPDDPNTVFATAANYPADADYSDTPQDWPGTGAVLCTTTGGSTNDNWGVFGNCLDAFDVEPEDNNGVGTRLSVNWARDRIHAAVHGHGYFRGSVTSPDSWERVQYELDDDLEGHCFAVHTFTWDGPMGGGDCQEEDKFGVNRRRVLIGHGSYNMDSHQGGGQFDPVGGIWYSDDFGSTWEQATLEDGYQDMNKVDVLCFEDIEGGNVVLAGCWDQWQGSDYAGILRSVTGGKTWRWGPEGGEPYLSARRVSGIRSHPQNPSEVYATVSQWNGGPDLWDDQNAGIWRSTNSGASWEKCITDGIGTLTMNCVEIPPNEPNTILVGTKGNGLWKGTIQASFGSPWAGTILFTGPLTASQRSPALAVLSGRDRRRIRFTIPGHAGPVATWMGVYSLGGRLIDVLVDDYLLPGGYELEWRTTAEGATPAAGMYICSLRTPEAITSGKILVIRP